jgi:hypothetical protein
MPGTCITMKKKVPAQEVSRRNHLAFHWKAGILACLLLVVVCVAVLIQGSSDDQTLRESKVNDTRRSERQSLPAVRDPQVRGTREEMARALRSNPKGLDFYLQRWQDEMNKPNPSCAGLAGAMALEGFGKEALQLATESFGPGKIRCGIVYAVFRASDPAESALLFALLEHGDEKDSACEGIGQVLAFTEAPHKLDVAAFAYLGEWRDRFLGAFAIKYVLQQHRGSPEEASQAYRSVFDLPLSEAMSRQILFELGGILPFDTWEHLGRAGSTLSGTERHTIIEQMFRADAARAIANVAAAAGREAEMTFAFMRWMELDSAEPIQWLQSHSGKLSAAQRDHAMRGVAEHSASRDNYDVAWQWIGRIDDADLRKKAEGQVWSMERDIVRKMVRNGPEAAIRSLVSGESQHRDYWLEEAMQTWISQDSAQAEEWYQKNWNSLPAAKSQFVAAAYAKEAVKTGDLVTALQWTNLIQDPKTRERISASIDKAQSTQGE